MIFNVAAPSCAGYDPDRFYPGWRDRLLASAARTGPSRPTRPAKRAATGRWLVDHGGVQTAGSRRSGEAPLVSANHSRRVRARWERRQDARSVRDGGRRRTRRRR